MLAFSSLNSTCKYQDYIFYEVIIVIIIIINIIIIIIIFIIIIIILIILIIKFFTRIELLVYCNVFKTPISKRMLNLCQIDSKNTTPGQEHF